MARKKPTDASPILSAAQLAAHLGVDRHTIVDSWVPAGCPTAQQADKDAGIPWGFRMADVWRWMSDGGMDDDQTTPSTSPDYEAARTRKTMAQAEMAELALERQRGSLVHIDDVAASVISEYSNVRAKLIGLHTKIAIESFGKSSDEIGRISKRLITEALEDLSLDKTMENSGDDTIEINEVGE